MTDAQNTEPTLKGWRWVPTEMTEDMVHAFHDNGGGASETWRAILAITPSPTPTAPQEADALREALAGLVAIVESAGVINLSRGVQLGPVVWSVRCNDAMSKARAALAQHQPATLGETK